MSEHTFTPKRVSGDYLAHCSCGWQGGVPEAAEYQAQIVWRNHHIVQIGAAA